MVVANYINSFGLATERKPGVRHKRNGKVWLTLRADLRNMIAVGTIRVEKFCVPFNLVPGPTFGREPYCKECCCTIQLYCIIFSARILEDDLDLRKSVSYNERLGGVSFGG